MDIVNQLQDKLLQPEVKGEAGLRSHRRTQVGGDTREDPRQKFQKFQASEFWNVPRGYQLNPIDKPVGKEIEKAWWN